MGCLGDRGRVASPQSPDPDWALARAEFVGLTMLSKPIELEFGGRRLTFSTLEELEFGLEGRTQVPAAEVSRLLQLSPTELRREATNVRDMERRFVDVLADALKEPGAIATHLLRIDPKEVTTDHQWREIITALANANADGDAPAQAGLVKYIQYLAVYREVVKGIYGQKIAGHPSTEADESSLESALKETLITEEVSESDTGSGAVRFERLPRGQTVSVRAPRDGAITILLSRHKFVLRVRGTSHLADDNGVHYPLGRGVQAIGRHPDNDVVVGGWYRDVSRKHIMVDVSDADNVELTDLSTHGTFVPGHLLVKHGEG